MALVLPPPPIVPQLVVPFVPKIPAVDEPLELTEVVQPALAPHAESKHSEAATAVKESKRETPLIILPCDVTCTPRNFEVCWLAAVEPG